MKKKALIFGITGQDGSYLAKYLVEKKYSVTGIYRRKKFVNLKKLDLLKKIKLQLLTKLDNKKINKILSQNFNEIYFLSGQSSVTKSFTKSLETYKSQIEPLKSILDFIVKQKKNKTKFLYAGSAEIFGNINKKKRINEESKKKPVSPYGLSKLIGYEIVKSYRRMYKIPVCTAHFFNHESSLRPKEFIFKKIINSLNEIKKNKKNRLKVGNIDIKRDWGWAPDYMEACYKIMNSNQITDYIVATKKTVQLKKIIQLFFKNYNLNWKEYTIVNKNFFRNFEIQENYANPEKIKKNIKWKAKNDYFNVIKKLINKEI
ncbi:GDPmannose 4,6-dehydratase [Candidatus Pelagibacter ubique]|uniref:GDP-mannose 4,6-dehydratase n=1 Tax=Pelagibacter ubique TaxID=198252 RepID=A0ABX1SZ07_PELUQ|nr:GDP-mannose 4,6-dehydratase [Candidatus Pelagibacter ubique]NMN67073.1 GDPmannose 4,6-dehydratase [Candidatus Pelagibacter ubique]